MNLETTIAQKLVGIVNITEDSFSDGGLYLDRHTALNHAKTLYADGAEFVELGPASSHPDATAVSGETEISRIATVLDSLLKDGIPIAIDSFQLETQLYCAARGVAMLNDTKGFQSKAQLESLAEYQCKLVFMFSVQGTGLATRVTSTPQEVLENLKQFFERQLQTCEAAGIAPERIVLDPGMGFFLGNTPDVSIAALKEIPNLKKQFGMPLLISVSRKSFLQKISGLPAKESGAATLAAELYAAAQGADYLRTHDVKSLRAALSVQHHLAQ